MNKTRNSTVDLCGSASLSRKTISLSNGVNHNIFDFCCKRTVFLFAYLKKKKITIWNGKQLKQNDESFGVRFELCIYDAHFTVTGIYDLISSCSLLFNNGKP